MADKKLNDLTAASDGAYVYAEDASGNQIKISKADLATVVADVFGLSFYMGADLNTVNTLKAKAMGFPTMFCSVYALNVNTYGDNYILGFNVRGGTTECQVGFGISTKRWYSRTLDLNTNVYGDWAPCDSFGCNTLEELAAALQPYLT